MLIVLVIQQVLYRVLVLEGLLHIIYFWNPGSLSGSIISNLQAGEYTLTVTDVNNCQEVDTFVISEPDALSVSITQNGFILTSSTPLGGTAPYSYSWIEQSSSLQVGTGVKLCC